MSTRLTSTIRGQILRIVLAHAFQARELAAQRELEDLGAAVYNDLYPDSIRELMEDLPAGYLPSSDKVKVVFNGSYIMVPFSGRRRLAERHQHNVAAVYGPGHPLSDRFEAWKASNDKLKSERSLAESTAKAVLISASTIKRLIEIWPEVEKFARPFETSKATALALPIKDLNAQLGLPPQ